MTRALFGCASLNDCGWTGPQVGRNKEGTEFCPNCGGFVAQRAALQAGLLDEDEHWAVERAADLLGGYAEYIRRVKPDDIEQHPYLPELEAVAAHMLALAKRNSTSGGQVA